VSKAAPCRAVIFDLDGTLIDSRPGIVAGMRHALTQLGHELPADMPLDWAIGPPLVEVMARLLAPFGDGRAEQAAARYREWYGAVGLFDAEPYGALPDSGLARKADLFRHLLAVEGLEARETVVVGDREHDVAAARDNGLRVVGCTWGYGSVEELAGADLLCDSPAELARLL
jgi:phosphoglycolate phosphatase